MRIVLSKKDKMKRGELLLFYHPKNKDVAKLVKNLVEFKTGEIEVKDDYNNRYIIPLLNVYYFECVDQKVFVYTKNDVYRLSMTFNQLKGLVCHRGFVQISVRTLINERHVTKYKMLRGCHRALYMDNEEFVVSTRIFKDNVNEMVSRRKIEFVPREPGDDVLTGF